MARPPGATLQTADGSYRIHEVVAVGGFASVYFGRNLKTNVPVAVKMLHPHHVSNDRVVRLFVHEAVLARGLRHPNVVGVVDQGQAEDGQPFIVMEWMTGWTVATLIEQRGAFEPGEAAFVADQTLRALSAAHSHQIYHRDIKPANVMLTADGVVKVMDFGISKDGSLAAATGASAVMGTPAYMAPEQFRGEVADARTDLYAVGVTLYQMLSGKVPFESTTTHGYMYLHLEKSPPSLRESRPDLPSPLENIVMIALEKSKERRFQSAEAMAAALASFSARRVVLPSRLPDGTMVAQASAVSPASMAPPAAPPSSTPPPPPRPVTRPPEPPSGPAWTPEPANPPTWPPSTGQPFDRQRPAPAPGSPYPGPPGPSPDPYGPGGWGTPPPAQPFPAPAPQRRPSFVWPLVAVAAASIVFGGLVVAYLLFEGRNPADPPTVTPGAIVAPASPPAAAEPKVTTAQSPDLTCSNGLTAAATQRQQHALPDAATTLEKLRAGGCDVTDALYEVDVDLGRELADAENTDEAIARFDLALQVKNGDEARNARALAAAYREGRSAIKRQSWDDAIQKLELVYRASPTYAHGNIVTHLRASHVGKGDDVRRQGNLDEALAAYQRAAQLKPDDAEVTARIRDTEDARQSRTSTQVAAREPSSTPVPQPVPVPQPPVLAPPASVPADLERVAQDYYAALNARRYDVAYGLLSSRARQQQTLDQFRARFSNTRGISVRAIENTRIQQSAGSLTVHTQTLNATPQGEQTACSRVEWALVQEQDGWRRDVVSGSGNEQGERC